MSVSGADVGGPFSAPTYAAPVGRRGLIFIVVVVALAVGAAWSIPFPAPWPAPIPSFSAILLVVLEVLLNSAARFKRHGDMASYLALDAPVVFAMFLLLDWRMFVIAVCVGELAIGVSDTLRHRNPTKWYVRVFNAAMIVLAGAAATLAYHVVPAGATTLGSDTWLAVGPFAATICALVAYRALDYSLVTILLDLAAGRPIMSERIGFRELFSESVVVAIGVPLALCWMQNLWIAAFALVSLAAGDVLLGIPEMEYRLRIDRRSGLVNAASFDDDFAEAVALAKKDHRTFALLVVDIDNFKTINDTYGHAAGDDVISAFSALLSKHVSDGDTLARVGGEEFTIVLHETGQAQAFAFAERLRASVSTTPFPIVQANTAIPITVSIGVANFPANGEDTRALFHAADTALYAAKRGGRNAVCAA